MIIFFQELVLLIVTWLLKLIDGIMDIFGALSGIIKVDYHGQKVNLLEFILADSNVNNVFWCVCILAVGLTCIFAIAGLIKNMVKNQSTVTGIVGKFFMALLGTIAMLAVLVLIILISNAVLILVSEVFQVSNTSKLSSAVFNACVADWRNGYSIREFNTDLSVREIFGDYDTTLLGVWPTSWKGNGMVDPNTFMYLPAIIATVALSIAFIVAVVNLSKRVFEIVFLYLTMPFAMSTLPLDDGQRFKSWRETFLTKVVLAYGTVFSVNIFVLLLPLITSVRVQGASGFANAMLLIFMLIGGAVVIPAGQALFARIFGQPDEMQQGSGFLRSAFYGSRFAAGATLGAIGGMFRMVRRANEKRKARQQEAQAEEDEQYTEDGEGESGE